MSDAISKCRDDVVAAAADLRAHLLDNGKIRGVGVHGRNQKIVVFTHGDWESNQRRRLEDQGWFGWPVQVVGLG